MSNKGRINIKKVVITVIILFIIVFGIVQLAKNEENNNKQSNINIVNAATKNIIDNTTTDTKNVIALENTSNIANNTVTENVINVVIENTVPKETETNKNTKKEKIPYLTDEAEERMNNLYTSDEKRVFLTFDDGPSQNVTPLILDVLKQNNIHATFFALGYRIDTYPSIVKRAYEEGNYIANHGYYHVYSKIYESAQTVLQEYEYCEIAIRMAIGVENYSSRVFRFPGGKLGGTYANVKEQAVELLDKERIAHVDWNALNRDAEGKFTKEELLSNVKNTSYGKNTVVLLMHDAGDKILTYESLQSVIDYFKGQGYKFCSFYDIMGEIEV